MLYSKSLLIIYFIHSSVYVNKLYLRQHDPGFKLDSIPVLIHEKALSLYRFLSNSSLLGLTVC